MKIISQPVSISELKEMANTLGGDMVKAVVDVDRQLFAVDAELHSDLEALLLENGSKQKNLWGINIYPALSGDDFVEFDSMINIRPSQGNRIRGVSDEKARKKIVEIVAKRVKR